MMTRPELKFRIFDQTLNKIDSYVGFFHNTIYLDNRFIVDRWTGLKDKNGIEIYENDLIKFEIKEWHDNKIYNLTNQLVKYKNEYAMFVFGDDEWAMNDHIYHESIEVVGNKYICEDNNE